MSPELSPAEDVGILAMLISPTPLMERTVTNVPRVDPVDPAAWVWKLITPPVPVPVPRVPILMVPPVMFEPTPWAPLIVIVMGVADALFRASVLVVG